MQDPTAAAAFQAIAQQQAPLFAEQEQLKCPRCASTNTKFCYYNNYNLSQPRHFCKNCRRYWTKGGSLRNIPVGGGTRKNNSTSRRSSSKRTNSEPNSDPNSDPDQSNRRVEQQRPPSESASLVSTQEIGSGSVGCQHLTRIEPEPEPNRVLVPILDPTSGSLLASTGQFGNIFNELSSDGSSLKMVRMAGFGEGLNSGVSLRFSGNWSGLDVQGGSGNSEIGSGDTSEWPNLAIFTPGPSFQ